MATIAAASKAAEMRQRMYAEDAPDGMLLAWQVPPNTQQKNHVAPGTIGRSCGGGLVQFQYKAANGKINYSPPIAVAPNQECSEVAE